MLRLVHSDDSYAVCRIPDILSSDTQASELFRGGQISVAVLYLAFIFFVPYGSNFQMLLRFPVFFLGVVLGKMMKEQMAMCSSKTLIRTLFILFVIGLALSIYAYRFCNPPCGIIEIPEIKKTGWLFVPYILMVPFFCLAVCSLFKTKLFSKILTPLRNVGVMSIELYLIHSQFIHLTRYLTDSYGWSKPLIGTVLVSFCFAFCWYVHKVNQWITDKLKNVKLIRT